ncbi:MAG: AlpA family phage regulatory protein [Steroidobacteraceae bacterium]
MRNSTSLTAATGDVLPQLLNVRDLAARTRLSVAGVYKLIAKGELPKPIKIGVRTSRWRADELAVWLEARSRDASASPNPKAAKHADELTTPLEAELRHVSASAKRKATRRVVA